ncbi:diguanylate cyclase (GGDEF)-like protein [Sulfuritortus calidifontis]|uniref:Diguanylate cyclase (GGDEF)-like protein n=1 Tax=Sulfuritortus calidifontis TaxID=1914471 RepID=A0A4R3JVS8_9PROT|nr:GGDEF and EAL domain-containing protein [Sulfuritortus calidifontis]TCS70557.1 diguanylate cyclase (GGDEF)-like protein [Sulfuritortus calidifontis]
MKAIKVHYFSIAYALIIAVVVAVLAALTSKEIADVADRVAQQEKILARQEMAAAIHSVANRIQSLSKNLALWDETKQQLMYTDYYQLWRDIRVKDAGILPKTIDTVALYGLDGRILAPSPAGTHLPKQLPKGKAMPVMTFSKDLEDGVAHYHLHAFFPIPSDPGGEKWLGYGGIQFDLVDELKAEHQFRYVDLSNISSNLPNGSQIDMATLADHLAFPVKPNQAFDQLSTIYEDSLLRLLALLLLILAAASWLIHRLIVSPIRSLAREINDLRENRQNGRTPSATQIQVEELDNLRRAFYDYHARLSDLNRNLESSSQEFYDQARRDPLTGVFNRRAYDEDWRGLNIERKVERCALILFDCDHFKAINDTYGHQTGDNVIRAVATTLQQTLRSEDRLYRLGGDEFATILVDGEAANAKAIATRCRERVLLHDFRQYGIDEPVTISIGIAHSGPGATLGELQKQADIAMYAAKRPSSSKIEVYDEQLQESSPLLANKSISAIYQTIQDPFLMEMRYQPVVQLDSREPVYVEALSRIKLGGEIILPGDIFPVVQARRIDAEYDQAVIQAVQRDMEFGRVPMHLGISINVSAVGLLSNKVTDMLVMLKQVYPEYKIVVEITETALIEQIDQATRQIHKLREAGCLIALDDFGSGYSSLRYLASMPVDLVKFDITMMRLLEQGDDRQKQVVREVAHLVRSAGYKMVAEGIENQRMLDQAMSLGFDYAQGFFLEAKQDGPA